MFDLNVSTSKKNMVVAAQQQQRTQKMMINNTLERSEQQPSLKIIFSLKQITRNQRHGTLCPYNTRIHSNSVISLIAAASARWREGGCETKVASATRHTLRPLFLHEDRLSVSQGRARFGSSSVYLDVSSWCC